MSGHAAAPPSGSALAPLAALALTLAIGWGVHALPIPAVPHAGSGLLALGLLLLVGDLLAQLGERLRLPHLTGYLAAGMLIGPHGLGLVSEHTVSTLSPLNTLALALIALSAGAELTWTMLRSGARSLGGAVVTQLAIAFPLGVAGLFLLRGQLPFLQGMSDGQVAGVALLWGSIALSRSPAAVLGVIGQLRPDGPLTRYAMQMVIAFDLVVLVLFALVKTGAALLLDPGAEFSLEGLEEVGMGLLGAVACGTTLGLAIALYLRLVGRQLFLFLLVVGYGASALAAYFQFETLVFFMTAGFVVANVTAQGERLLEAVGDGGRIVHVVFFALAGAHLDLHLLARLWPVALALFAARVGSTWVACEVSARWVEDPPVVRRFGWMPLVCQAGVTIGMAVQLPVQFPAFGTELAALVIAVVGINELTGPVGFAWSLRRAGEVPS